MARSLYAKLHRRFGQRRSGEDRARTARLMVERVPPLFPPEAADRSALPLAGARVAVVGAGFAGLAAAWSLTVKWGAAVDVFEARDRVGGRVLSLSSDPVPGRVIEAGAELIGINHPVWLYLARRYGLGLSVLTSEDEYAGAGLEMPLYLDGRLIPPDEQKKIFEEMDRVLALMAVHARTITDPFAPWTAPRAAEWDGISVQQWLDALSPRPSDPCLAALRVMLENDNVLPMSEQSYLGLLALIAGGGFASDGSVLYWTETEVFRCETGNQALAVRLAEEVSRTSPTSSINLGVRATALVVEKDGVLVAAGGTTVPYDYAVLAIPPSTWETVEVTPALPASMKMGMGPGVKYLSPVDGRFWIRDGLAPSGASTPLGEVWEGTDNQMVVDGQGIELSVFAGGTAASRAIAWHGQNPGRPMSDYYAPLLAQLYPGYPAAQLGGTFVSWPDEEWTRAGYACPTPNQVRTVGPFLNEMYHDRLAFAGEHTCLAYFGYMEGALQSGVAAAQRIAAARGVVPLGMLRPYPAPVEV